MTKTKDPIRLKVAYKGAESLLSAFTQSVGKGSVVLPSRKSLPTGTRFIFELYTGGVSTKVEVLGEVVRVTPGDGGKFLLQVAYYPPKDRGGLDEVLTKLFDAHRTEKKRKHPRIPINIRATEETAYSPAYLIKDISRGGMGAELEIPQLPKYIQVGAPFLLELDLLGQVSLFGEVAWTRAGTNNRALLVSPALGVSFGKLRAETQDQLTRLLSLQRLPAAPWKARVSFGREAVARMP